MLKIYAHSYLVGLQSALVYRWNFALRCLFAFVPLMGTYFFWGAVFGGKGDIQGYSYDSMMLYFVGLLLIDTMTSPTEDDFQIASDIKDGFINQVLLKPVNYGLYRFSLYVASRTVYLLSALLPLTLLFVLIWNKVAWPQNVEHWLYAVLAVAGSAVLQFTITFCTGLAAFWLMDVGGIIFILFGLEYVAGGHIFPLDLLPDWLYRASLCLPFAYEHFFPLAVLTGRLTEAEIARGFMMQGAWIALTAGLAYFMWRQGLKKYGAVGG